MKIAIITDQHAGARNGSDVVLWHQRKFYEEVFFPYLESNGIKEIVGLGDLFDKRKSVDFKSLFEWREFFFDPMRDKGMRYTGVLGNHDVAFKNTNTVNSPGLLLNDYDNIRVIDKATEIPEWNMVLIPWITKDNGDDIFSVLSKTTMPVLGAHLELAGFEMYRGNVQEKGMDASLFKKFDKVLTGHYHTKSSKGNVHYLGSPYEMTWNDANDARGFHIYDTETQELEYVENPFTVFETVFYSENKTFGDDWFASLENKYLQIILKDYEDFKAVEEFLHKVQAAEVADFTVKDTTQYLMETEETEDVDVDEFSESTLKVIGKHVDSLDTHLDKGVFKKKVQGLYHEALEAM